MGLSNVGYGLDVGVATFIWQMGLSNVGYGLDVGVATFLNWKLIN